MIFGVSYATMILIGIIFIAGVLFSLFIAFADYEKNIPGLILGLFLTILTCSGIFAYSHWYYNSTASGARSAKDIQSELNNGINREMTVTAEDGRVIEYYKGKCDIEISEDGRKVKFEDAKGYRHIWVIGELDTFDAVEY